MKGSAQPYFTHAYTSQDAIFICEGVTDAWVIWQNLKDFNLFDTILVSFLSLYNTMCRWMRKIKCDK